MVLIYRYPVIYQAITTGMDEIPVIETGWDQIPTTPIVRRTPLYDNIWSGIPEEIPSIGTGWDQLAGVIRRPQLFLSSIGQDLEEVAVVDTSGDFPFFDAPVLIVQPRVVDNELWLVPDGIAVIETGWEMFTPPQIVRAKPAYLGDWVIGEEIPPIGTGWDQTSTAPIILRAPFFLSPGARDDSELIVVVEDPGWDQAFLPMLIRRPAFFPEEAVSAIVLIGVAAPPSAFAPRRLVLN